MSKQLNVITLVTKSYVDLLQAFFLETLPKEVENIKIMYVNDFDNSRYNNVAKFLEKKRLEIIYNEIKTNMGNNIFFIDSDVVFAKNAKFIDEINKLLEDKDLLFQFNDTWYNFGVFAISCNERTEELFRHFLEYEIDKVKTVDYLHDQHQINALLGINHGEIHDKSQPVLVEKIFTEIKHGHLPLKYFANHFNNMKFPNDVPSDVVLFHATNTYSMSEKLTVMNSFKNRFFKKSIF